MRETPLFGSRAIAVAIVLYIGLVLFASFHFNISLTADRVAVLLVIAALGTGRIRSFLRDWSAFVVVILAWQVLQGMSHSFTHLKPHVTEMIVVDRFLFFGHVPTIWLQSRFWNPDNAFAWQGVLPDAVQRPHVHYSYFHGVLHWYDIVATAFYTMHFVFPLGVAFALWFWKRDIFLEYMAAFMLLALAGFATYVLFPAAPPWVAANWYHDMPHVTRIFEYGVNFFGGDQSYSALTQWTWQHGGYDIFGAVPSEHAAFPFLGFLFVRQAWRRAGWALLAYCLGVWISVMYLGEHYATDVLVGVLYAGAVYVSVLLAMRRKARLQQRAVNQPAVEGVVSERLPA